MRNRHGVSSPAVFEANMPSRKKRKRDRLRAEATAKAPETLGGWGGELSTTLADLVWLRRAIRENWPVPQAVRQSIVDELFAEVKALNGRYLNSVVRTALAMEDANIQAETAAHNAYAAR
jgi:hypothetical protein